MESISRTSTHKSRHAGWFLILFGLVFAGIGGVAVYFMTVRPVLRIQNARSWPAVPCEIVSSKVESHSDSDGTTYRVAMTYRYEVDGQTYIGDRYQFMGGSSSGRSGKAAVVRKHPPGSQATCYVNPADPTDAVIHRGYTRDMLFGLIPVVFVLVGAGIITGGVTSLRRSSRSSLAAHPDHSSDHIFPPSHTKRADRETPASSHDSDPTPTAVTLDADSTRLGKLAGVTLFAVLWNGMAWFMMAMAWRDGAWFGVVFLTIFVAIGFAIVVGAIYLALALFNPTVRLTLSRRDIPLGSTLDIEWELIGRAGRLRSFNLTLEGVEKATYRRGTDTVTDDHTFRIIDIARIDDRRDLLTARGRASVDIPTDTMPTWKARRNEITWAIRAHGQVPRWPDVNDTWSVNLLPQKVSEGREGTGM